MLRVGALEPDRHVGDRVDPVEVDEDRDEPLLLLAVAQRPLQQARLPVLARRVEAHVVAADRVLQQLVGLPVPIEDVLGRDRPRVDERVDVGDHVRRQRTEKCAASKRRGRSPTYQATRRRFSGEGGIRTLEAGISPPNALAGRRLQPLGHFSGRAHRTAGPCTRKPARARAFGQRRERDLNPRCTFRHIRDFQSRSLDRSDTPPSGHPGPSASVAARAAREHLRESSLKE